MNTAERRPTRGRPAALEPHHEQLLEWDRQGVPVAEQARWLGVNSRTVTRYRVRSGITPARPGNRRKPPELVARMGELLADGMSRAEVARTVGVIVETVDRHYPDAPRWTPEEAGRYGGMVRWLNRMPDDRCEQINRNQTWRGAKE